MSFFGYWIFDNLLIFAKMKILEAETKGISKKAMWCWWLAGLCNIVINIRKLLQLNKTESYYRKLIREAPEKKDMFTTKFAEIKAKRSKSIRALFKSGSDFLTASRGNGKAFI